LGSVFVVYLGRRSTEEIEGWCKHEISRAVISLALMEFKELGLELGEMLLDPVLVALDFLKECRVGKNQVVDIDLFEVPGGIRKSGCPKVCCSALARGWWSHQEEEIQGPG